MLYRVTQLNPALSQGTKLLFDIGDHKSLQSMAERPVVEWAKHPYKFGSTFVENCHG